MIDKNHKVKGSISKAVKVGGANKPRPLSYSGGLYVTAGGKKTKNIGSKVSDITATFGGTKAGSWCEYQCIPRPTRAKITSPPIIYRNQWQSIQRMETRQ